jgi:hypothetical protein
MTISRRLWGAFVVAFALGLVLWGGLGLVSDVTHPHRSAPAPVWDGRGQWASATLPLCPRSLVGRQGETTDHLQLTCEATGRWEPAPVYSPAACQRAVAQGRWEWLDQPAIAPSRGSAGGWIPVLCGSAPPSDTGNWGANLPVPTS